MYVCMYVCLLVSVRVGQNICPSSVFMSLVCLYLDVSSHARTSLSQSSFIRSYETTLVRTVWLVCTSVYMYVQTYCMCTYKLSLECTWICMSPMYVRTDGRTYGRTYVCLYMCLCKCNRQLVVSVCQLVLSVCICVCQSVGQYICPSWVCVSLNCL